MNCRRPTRITGLFPLLLTGLLLSYCVTLSNVEGLAQDSGRPVPGSVLARQATIYYVATTGDDDNPGTIDLPWQTIQKAANTLVAGDTVYIRAGTYPEQVIPQNSGSAGQYITYAAYPGETATIDGTGVVVPESGGLFDLQGGITSACLACG